MSEDCKVLIVDDLDHNAVAMAALLQRPGLQLMTARSGTEALEILLVHDVAVALVDVQMPGMDGFELADLMRGTERTREVPIIFVTASGHDTERMSRGYETGAVDYLLKPLDPIVIRSKVEVFVQLHQQQRELSRRLSELAEALHVNEMFMAMLGHDLRSPLASIMNSAHLVSRTVSEPAAVTASNRILHSGARMARLIEQMLDTARIRAGQFDIEPRPTDLGHLGEQIRSEITTEHHVGTVDLRTVGDAAGTWDADRLAQLMSNLVRNAVQHGSPSAPVRVVIDGSDPQRVTLEVCNAGAICPSLLPSLFNPFHAGKPADRGSGRGLGLGLYISHEIVRAHGGAIRVLTDGEAGTVFKVSLPRHAGRPALPVDVGKADSQLTAVN
jgi:two-component system, sensor histidine kinase and response regulator